METTKEFIICACFGPSAGKLYVESPTNLTPIKDAAKVFRSEKEASEVITQDWLQSVLAWEYEPL